MRSSRSAELLGCVAVALIAHLALLADWAPDGGGASMGGSGGSAALSIEAAPESLAAMVEAWETPPEIAPPVEPAEPPPPPPEAPQAIAPPAPVAPVTAPPPSLPTAPGLVALPPVPTAVPPKPAPEAVAEAPPEPEPEPEAEPEPEPQAPVAIGAVPQRRPDTLRPPQRETPREVARAPSQDRGSAAQTSNGRAEQRAAGTGGGAVAGRGNAPVQAAGPARGEIDELKRWGSAIQARVSRAQTFPREARGSTGRVMVQITVGRDGSLREALIAGSSGDARFDQAALEAVKRARLPSAPSGLSLASHQFRIPILFQ